MPLSSLLTIGARWSFVAGKGGVGKTTSAAALAVELADAGERVLVLSLDPAHSLGDALGQQLGGEASPVWGLPRLEALEVDVEHERERFLSTNRGRILRLLERGSYLDRADAAGFVDLALPGMDELAALLRLLELREEDGRRVVVDTAPTGHTLRLLELPTLARSWLAALEAMEEKHQAVARALAGAAPADEVTEMLGTLDRQLAALEALLRDPALTRFVLVSTPEPVVLAETRRYEEELSRRGIALAGVVVNRAEGASEAAMGGGMIFVPRLRVDLGGVEGARAFARAASARPPGAETAESSAATLELGKLFDPPPDRVLYLVGGKGGVGKSTTACALAIRLAESRGGGVLLLGTDPAGSLGDVLAMEVSGEARDVPDVAGLRVQELEAPAVWEAFREEFRADAERLFAGLLGGTAAADQRVVERLVDLAPPGIDELMALLEVVDFLEEGRFDVLVLDTAPTGHLLRLLEMPEIALQWSHALLRLLLKYREVIGLGELAERVLRLSRSLRSLRELLTDGERTWLLAVALPEALSVPETRRLLERTVAMRIPLGAILVNRAAEGDAVPDEGGHARALLALAGDTPVIATPRLGRGPRGVGELRALSRDWRLVRPEGGRAGVDVP